MESFCKNDRHSLFPDLVGSLHSWLLFQNTEASCLQQYISHWEVAQTHNECVTVLCNKQNTIPRVPLLRTKTLLQWTRYTWSSLQSEVTNWCVNLFWFWSYSFLRSFSPNINDTFVIKQLQAWTFHYWNSKLKRNLLVINNFDQQSKWKPDLKKIYKAQGESCSVSGCRHNEVSFIV